MLNDVELVARIQETQDKYASSILYKRYQGLIVNYGIRFLRQCNRSFDFDLLDDFISDAYFSFRKAVKYVDLDKIYDRNKWKFHYVFIFFLKNQQRKYRKEAIERYETLSCIKDKDASLLSYDWIDYYDPEKEMNNLMRHLTKDQQKILNYRQLGLTIQDIADKLNKSSTTIHRCIKKAKYQLSCELDIAYV